MLLEASLAKKLWGEAVVVASYFRNISPAFGKITIPWELFWEKKPSVTHLRVFGSRAFVHVPEDKCVTPKLSEKSQVGILVGYLTESKAYRVLLKDTQDVIISVHVDFIEVPQRELTSEKDRLQFDLSYNSGSDDGLRNEEAPGMDWPDDGVLQGGAQEAAGVVDAGGCGASGSGGAASCRCRASF
jgi:hypothetical protein